MKYILAVFFYGFVCSLSYSQELGFVKPKNKGKFYLYWGWNRGAYTDSDIHFKGSDYDFVLYDVKAQDRQTPFSAHKYLHPGNLTIPQTNFRFGYFFHENYTISFGFDHMKYVMVQDQEVSIKGEIDGGYPYDGIYESTIELTPEFLTYEHTDGLNYVNLELNRFDDISAVFGLYATNFQINLTEGLGLGFLFPRTDSSLLGKDNADDFHVSGFGLSAKVGLNFTIFKHFFIQTEFKSGYINLTDVRTTNSASDTATQDFGFVEGTLVFGGRFKL